MSIKSHLRSLVVWSCIVICTLQLLGLLQFYWERDGQVPYSWDEITSYVGHEGLIVSEKSEVDRLKAIRLEAQNELHNYLAEHNIQAVGHVSSYSWGIFHTIIYDEEDALTDWLKKGVTFSQYAGDRAAVWAVEGSLYAKAYEEGQVEFSYMGVDSEIIGVFDYINSPLATSQTAQKPQIITEFPAYPIERLDLQINTTDQSESREIKRLIADTSVYENFTQSTKFGSEDPFRDFLKLSFNNIFTVFIVGTIFFLLICTMILINMEITYSKSIHFIHDLCGAGTKGLLISELKILVKAQIISIVLLLVVDFLLIREVFAPLLLDNHPFIRLFIIFCSAILYDLLYCLSFLVRKKIDIMRLWKQVKQA